MGIQQSHEAAPDQPGPALPYASRLPPEHGSEAVRGQERMATDQIEQDSRDRRHLKRQFAQAGIRRVAIKGRADRVRDRAARPPLITWPEPQITRVDSRCRPGSRGHLVQVVAVVEQLPPGHDASV
jgi:hypothetical protein